MCLNPSKQTAASEMGNSIDVLWNVEGVRTDAAGVVYLSRCSVFLNSMGKTAWIQYLWLDQMGLKTRLRRKPMDEGRKSIQIVGRFKMLAKDGNPWCERRISKDFLKGDWSDTITLATRQELQDNRNVFLVKGLMRLHTRLWSTENSLLRPVALLAKTKAGLRRKITLKVELFSDLTTENEREYTLEKLSYWNHDVKLVLFLDKGQLCVRFRSDKENGSVLVETVHLKQIDAFGIFEGKQFLCWQGEQFVQVNTVNDHIAFIDEKLLIEKSSLFLTQNELHISFQITDYVNESSCLASEIVEGKHSVAKICDAIETVSQEINTDNILENRDPNYLLGSDFLSLLENETLSDFKLRIGQEYISVHKAVLCARSPVFRAMLESPMLEACQNEVDVPDFHPDTVRRLVRYLYSGSVPDLDSSTAPELYSASDKYAVFGLRDQCSRVMLSGLDTKNACRVLLLSDTHQDPKLKRQVLDYIWTHEQQVFLSQEWDAFMKDEPLLALEVSHHLHVKKYDAKN